MDRVPSTPLRDPALRAARVVALTLLEDARGAARRFREVGDSDEEALHDFRVGVRRLRSWLQPWAAWLEDSVSRGDQRKVRDIARRTGPARDIDVHLEWVREQRRGGSARQRDGITALMDRLEARRPAATSRALDAADDMDAMHARLARRLAEYRVRVRAPPDEAETRFGVVLARLVRDASDSLRQRLVVVRSPADDDAAHRVRIAAKRLRYLLEPAAASCRGEAAISGELKALQDVVGDLHDTHVFADEIASMDDAVPPATQLLLARHLRERGASAYAVFAREWLGKASAPFFTRVGRLAGQLERSAEGSRP
jgi:CHAD domain-containing protein